MLFAEASNEFYGQWVIVALGIVGGLGGLAAIASYFATRRELEGLEKRVSGTEETLVAIRAEMKTDKEDLIAIGEKRSTVLHNRINPLIENTAALKGAQESFVQSFDNFTTVMKQLTETIREEKRRERE